MTLTLGKRAKIDISSDDEVDPEEELELATRYINLKEPYRQNVLDLWRSSGVKRFKMDLHFYLSSLVHSKVITDKERQILEYVGRSKEGIMPLRENIDLIHNYIRRKFFKFANHEKFHVWWQYMACLYTVICDKEWFTEIRYWVSREIFKSNRAKQVCEHVNRTLILSGKSGVGKTTFCQRLIDPVLETYNMQLGEYIYQHPSILGEKVRVFVSPDDASFEEMYQLMQVIQGEVSLQIKGHNSPLDCKFKSSVICTNIPGDELKDVEHDTKPDFKKRFLRRSIIADIGSDRDIYNFVYARDEAWANPPPDFRAMFFWKMMIDNRDSKDLELKDAQYRPPMQLDPHGMGLGDDNVTSMRYFDAVAGMKTVDFSKVFPELTELMKNRKDND